MNQKHKCWWKDIYTHPKNYDFFKKLTCNQKKKTKKKTEHEKINFIDLKEGGIGGVSVFRVEEENIDVRKIYYLKEERLWTVGDSYYNIKIWFLKTFESFYNWDLENEKYFSRILAF